MPFYTMAQWHVKSGQEKAFEQAWERLATTFGAVPGAPRVQGTLLRRTDNPQHYASFGEWPNLEAIQAMRADPAASAAIDRLRAMCSESDPGAYEVVRVASTHTVRTKSA